MAAAEPARQPIGYWVKHLDRLLDESLDAALATDTLARRHWQILNLLADHPADHQELTAALDPFVSAGSTEIADVVDDLRHRGWLRVDEATLLLTDQGRAAQQRLATQVSRVCRLVVDGISAAEYAATVDVLARMADNLTAAIEVGAALPPGRGPG